MGFVAPGSGGARLRGDQSDGVKGRGGGLWGSLCVGVGLSGAVVVPGARAVTAGWGREQGLSLQTPVIVKYRDERTDLSTALESWLR